MRQIRMWVAKCRNTEMPIVREMEPLPLKKAIELALAVELLTKMCESYKVQKAPG